MNESPVKSIQSPAVLVGEIDKLIQLINVSRGLLCHTVDEVLARLVILRVVSKDCPAHQLLQRVHPVSLDRSATSRT